MLNSIFVIIGTIIGAGFASGKEIFSFFNVSGAYGLLGLFFSGIIIGLIIYKIFYIVISFNVQSYNDFFKLIFSKSTFFSDVMYNIVNIFLLISYIVMVAGFAAYFTQEFSFPYYFGAIIISILSFITFFKDIDGVVKINTYLIPCIFIIVLLLAFKNLSCFTKLNVKFDSFNLNWVTRSILYSSYNLIIVTPILISLKKYVYTLHQAKIVSIGTVLFLLLIALILFFLLNCYFDEIYNLDLPIVYIASKQGLFYKFLCGLLILGAIFTTAISNGYGFLNNLNITNRKSYLTLSFLICFFAIILSKFGFTTLLNLLYPILGIFRFNSNYFYCIFL